MNFTVNTERLLGGLRRVMSAVSSKSLNAMLNNILVEAEGDKVFLTAYDLELRIRTAIPATVTQRGAIAVPAKKFNEIVGALPMGDLVFETGEENAEEIRLVCQKANYKIHGQNADGFPAADPFAEEWSFGIGGKELVDCLCKTVYAKSTDESRQALNGVLVSIRGGMRTIAASDGRRLALVEHSLEPAAEGENTEAAPAVPTSEGEFILPSKVVLELIRAVDQSKAVQIHLTHTMALFEIGDTTLSSKLVDKAYPNYRSVIPVSFRNQVMIPRALFADVLRRVRMMINESEGGASIALSISDNTMTISASSQEFGEAHETIDVELTGEPINIAFNPQYLGDPLKTLACDKFELKFNDGVTPVEMTGDPGFIYILMPMRGN